MKKRSARLFGIMVLVLGVSSAEVQAEFALKDADRVVLFGDMALGEVYFTKWLDLYQRIAHPQLQAHVIAMSTDERGSQAGMVDRLGREVLPLEPTKVVLCFGLSDPQRKALSTARLDQYAADLEKVIETLKSAKAEVILLTPPAPEPERNRGLTALNYDSIIDAYVEKVKAVGGKADVPVLDWNQAIKDYWAASPSGVKRSMTLEGLSPSPLSIAICVDLLLAHWKAEPIGNLIELKWSEPTSVSTQRGAASVASSGENTRVLRLERVPVPLHMPERIGIPDAEWPMSKWCEYRLRIPDLPDGGLAIKDNNPRSTPLLVEAAAAREGADLTSAGPLVNNEISDNLRTYMMTKANQFRRFQRSLDRPVPEPELEEGYRLYAESERAMALGATKIFLRLPIELTTEVTITLLDSAAFEAARQTPPPAPRRPRPSRSAPKLQPPSGE